MIFINCGNIKQQMFCNINQNNIITNLTKKEIKHLDLQIASSSNLNSLNESSISKYINQLFFNKNKSDLFSSSISLCNSYFSKQAITINELKSAFSFLENSDSFQDDLFSFNQENVETLGKLLMYSYKQIITNSQINSISSFTSAYEAVINEKINIKKQHKHYKKQYQSKISFISYLKLFKGSPKNDKYLPPEMIFIINRMKKISKLNFELINFNPIAFYYFILILLNEKWIFPSFDDIEIVITNDSLLRSLHSRYGKDLIIEELKHNKAIKSINYEKGVFFKRLQFNYSNNYINISQDAYGVGDGMNGPGITNLSRLNSLICKEEVTHYNSIQISNDHTSILTTNNENSSSIIHYSDIINNNAYSFEYIIVLSHFIQNWKKTTKLTLSFSEIFEREIQKSMNKKYKIDFKKYHFVDSYLVLNQLNELNIEFNSLDFKLFEKVFNFLNTNKKLHTLRISLFLSEAHYYPASLFKLYQSLETNLKITAAHESTLNKKVNDNDDIDYMIVDHLSIKFTQNIQLMFWNLKWLMLTELCIIIESPNIINSNDKYVMTVLKFIMNMLLLLNSSICQYNTFKLIAPFVHMDKKRLSDIEDFFEVIDLNKTNYNLRNLSVQFQLYDIVHVSHLLTQKLHSIYIGDFNPQSLNYFIMALNKFSFRKECKLQLISIGILSIVTKVKYVYTQLVVLCNLMMPLLSFIEIRSNLCFEEKQYTRFIDSINGSFVKNLTFEFNHKSKETISLNTIPLYYHDYYTLVEILNYKANCNSKIRKSLQSFLMNRKEVSLTINYK